MPPSLILSLSLASIVGLLFHSLFGRRLWQLPCYWLAAIAGFLLGEILADLTTVGFFRLGNIPVLLATAGALFGLAVCWFFTSPQEPRPRRRRPARRN